MRKVLISCFFFVVVIFGTACSSNNASKLRGMQVLKNTENSSLKLPAPEMHIVFKMDTNDIEIVEILPSRMGKKKLIELLKNNEGKSLTKGDSLTDCIIITNTEQSKSCFEISNSNIPDTSIFHDSEVSGATIALTVLVPYIAVGAAMDGDFYVQNKIDGKLVNQVGIALKDKIYKVKQQMQQALKTYDFSQLTRGMAPYGAFIEHQTLIQSIKRTPTLKKHEALQAFFKGIDYHGFVVKGKEINQRIKPTTNSKINNKHKRGQLILAEKIDKGWLFNGQGWVYKKILLSLQEDAQKELVFQSNKLQIAKNKQQFVTNKDTSSQEILEVLNNKSGLQGVSKKQISQLVKLKDQAVEKEAFLRAQKLNTVGSYGHYLGLYPKGHYYTKADKLRESVWFVLVQKQRSPKHYRAFLQEYPKSEHYQTVRTLWFEHAKNVNEVLAYRDFLAGYKMEKLEQQARAGWFDIAKQKNNVADYRAFLAGFAVAKLEDQALQLLEPIWYKKIKTGGEYSQLSYFLNELPKSKHVAKITYAYNNCIRIARDYFTTVDTCVSRYLNIKKLNKDSGFYAFAQAFALTGREADFNQAQNLARNNEQKKIVEYFSLSELKDKNRLFSIQLKDKHRFLGSTDHAVWFAQAKGSSSAKIKGDLIISTKKDAPLKIKYGNYNVKTSLGLKAYYAKEVRSNWVGSSNTNPVVKDKREVNVYISGLKQSNSTAYDFGNYQVAYKDTGMMGGYTAQYLEREIEFNAQVVSILPTVKLDIF